ncbi:MAG: hypothetical protein AAF624_11370 [Bacteroidota bacterium]
MQSVLDHLNASIVGTGVLLVLVGITLVGNETTVDQSFFTAARTQAQAFADVLEEDFINIGSGVPTALDDLVAFNAANTFTFRRKLDPADTTFAEISYQWAAVNTIQMEMDSGTTQTVPLYQVTRTVDGVQSGASPATLSEFTIDLRDDAGASTTTLGDASRLHVRFEALYAGANTVSEHTDRRSRWARTYHPPNLNR